MMHYKNATLKQYQRYEPTTVPWLEQMPHHWRPINLQHLSNLAPKSFTDGDWIESPYITTEGIRLIQTGNIGVGKFIEKGFRYISPITFEELNCTEVKPGDILICRLGDPVGRACAAPELGRRMITSVDVCIVKTGQNINPSFAIYAMSSKPYLDWVNSLVRGSTRDRISRSMLGKFVIPLPPPEEQAAIVGCLDDAEEQIQAYISGKQRLIALLEEQRQAVTHQAVTRGLNPNVKLKPSGVEWLDDVPEHWDISRVKNEFLSLNHRRVPLSSVERGAMTESKYDYYGASGVIDKVDNYLFNDQLLLIAEDGANLLLRNLPLAIIARGKFWVNNHAHILKPKRGNLEFLASIMEGLNYSPWISGAAQPKLTQDRLMSISISVPSKAEQDKVIEDTVAATSNLTQGIEHARRQVKLMEEYRTSLIADVVTGKLDVRKAAAELPDLEPTEMTD